MTRPARNVGIRTGGRRWRDLAALLVALTLITAACGGDDDDDAGTDPSPGGTTETTAAAGDPKAGGELVVGLESESAGWLPGKDSQSQAGLQVMYAVFDPLMAYDENGEVGPYLAESLEPNADFSEYTLTLRPGITFHDGTPLDAAAIKDNFDNYLKPPTARTTAALAAVSFEATGDLTGVYTLDPPSSAFPDLLTNIIGMPFSPTAAAEMGDDASSHPVGTGPFTFVSWQRDSELVVEKNPDYWQDGKPYLDRITFRPIPDEEARLASLQSGEVDVMHTVRQAQALAEAGDDVQSLVDIGGQSAMTYYNTTKPPTDDLRVRQALVHAVDQDELISVQGLEGITQATYQPVAPDSPWATDDAEAAYPAQDVEKATELLQEYMDDPDRSDGKAPGEPVSISLVVTAGVASLNDLGQLYQESWEAVGFDASIDFVDQATLVNRAVGSPPDFAGDYVATLFRLGIDSDPDNLYTTFYDEKAGGNIANWSPPEAKELWDIGHTSTDDAERKEAYAELWTLMAEQVPLSYHGALATAIGAKSDVMGIPDWTLPDGTRGEGYPTSIIHYVEVWLDR
jgi:peptide/nickel transport system substrate-binding protein